MRRLHISGRVLGWGFAFFMIVSGPHADVLPNVSLTAQAEITDSHLVVSYVFTNNSEQPVLISDRMIGHDAEGQEKLAPDAAYVFWEPPDSVRLVRAELNLPKEFDIYMKEIPYARIVPAHTSVEGAIKLSLPLEEDSPFYAKAHSWEARHCSRLHLVIGWQDLSPGMKILHRTLPNAEVEVIQDHSAYPKLVDAWIQIDSTLKKRTDEFDRRMPLEGK